MATGACIAPKRSQAILELADYLGDNWQSKKGTDLEGILQSKDIGLMYRSFDEAFDGLLVLDKGRFRVYCNTRTGNQRWSARSRFTIAHEIGHFFIDEHRKALQTGMMASPGEYASKDLIIEREADLFASRLLMPTRPYRTALKRAEAGLAGVVTLADTFNVSVKCSGLRFVSEDLRSCCLAFWNWNGELVWKWCSDTLWKAGIRKLKHDPVRGGATSSALASRRTGVREVETSSAPANYLFNGIDGSYFGEIFTEEAIALGEYGVLALLTASSGRLRPLADVLEQRYARR